MRKFPVKPTRPCRSKVRKIALHDFYSDGTNSLINEAIYALKTYGFANREISVATGISVSDVKARFKYAATYRKDILDKHINVMSGDPHDLEDNGRRE